MVLNLPEFGHKRQPCLGLMTKVLGAAQRFRQPRARSRPAKESRLDCLGNLTSDRKTIIKPFEKGTVMIGRANACLIISALDAQSGEGSLFSPVFKTRATKTTTKTV